jgi:hypothetical protein
MRADRCLLLEALRHPEKLPALGSAEWGELLRQARHGGVLARLGIQLDELGLLGKLPVKVVDHLEAARAIADQHARVARWEVNRLQRVLRGTPTPVVLLKGAAYILADLPPARGRLCTDVDILVPRDNLAAVEAILLANGWRAGALDAYDQRYYREWTHELPPLEHQERGTYLDVHHNIAPIRGSWPVDANLLLADAVPVAGTSVRVLAPTDMVLHSATHLLQDGELDRGLRDLTDLNDLLRHFGARPGFWEQLVARARQLGLRRPLYYALAQVQQLLETPVPAGLRAAVLAGKPAWPKATVMDFLVNRALVPEPADSAPWTTNLARWLLYVRAHWQRMPPWPLANHMVRKSLKSWFAPRKEETQ